MIMEMEVVDTRPILTSMRAGLLMQVRWIEEHGHSSDTPQALRDFYDMLRRSNLTTVREIERQLGIKPKQRRIGKRRP